MTLSGSCRDVRVLSIDPHGPEGAAHGQGVEHVAVDGVLGHGAETGREDDLEDVRADGGHEVAKLLADDLDLVGQGTGRLAVASVPGQAAQGVEDLADQHIGQEKTQGGVDQHADHGHAHDRGVQGLGA